MPAKKEQLLALTGIRFFLGFWVCLFHLFVSGGFLSLILAKLPSAVAAVLGAGWWAVSLFFVLSGFVLSYNYSLLTDWSSQQTFRFLASRFARIYPAYCVGLLLTAPFIGYSLFRNFSTMRLSRDLGVAALNWTLLQAWIPGAALTWNPVGWSLSDEAFFYLCFPVVGVALWKMATIRGVAVAGLIICAAPIVFSSLANTIAHKWFPSAFSISETGHSYLRLFLMYNPLVNLPDFCVGILTGRIYYEIATNRRWLLGCGYWLYLPALAGEMILIVNFASIIGSYQALQVFLHAAVILGLALGGGTLCRILSTRPVVYLGNTSYALYIIHLPIGMWLNVSLRLPFMMKLSGFAFTVLWIVTVLVMSSVVFEFVESPANRFLRRALNA